MKTTFKTIFYDEDADYLATVHAAMDENKVVSFTMILENGEDVTSNLSATDRLECELLSRLAFRKMTEKEISRV